MYTPRNTRAFLSLVGTFSTSSSLEEGSQFLILSRPLQVWPRKRNKGCGGTTKQPLDISSGEFVTIISFPGGLDHSAQFTLSPTVKSQGGKCQPTGICKTTGCLSRKPAHLEVLKSCRNQQKAVKGGSIGIPHSFQPTMAVLDTPTAALWSINVDFQASFAAETQKLLCQFMDL